MPNEGVLVQRGREGWHAMRTERHDRRALRRELAHVRLQNRLEKSQAPLPNLWGKPPGKRAGR